MDLEVLLQSSVEENTEVIATKRGRGVIVWGQTFADRANRALMA